MKNHITILCLLLSSIAFGQSKSEILIQKWKLNKVIDFGQEYALLESQKQDWMNFLSDGKFKGIIEGKHIEGKWTIVNNKTKLSVNKTLSKININWTKVKSIEKAKFSMEYQNGDLITTTLLFIPYK